MTQQTVSSLAEFYADPASPYAAFPQEHRSGGSMPIYLLRTQQVTYAADDPATPQTMLSLTTGGTPVFRWNVGDGLVPEQGAKSGDILLLPANTNVQHETRGYNEVIHIIFETAKVASLFDELGHTSLSALAPLTDATLFRDETVRRTIMQMWVESARHGGTSDLLMDGLTQVLLARLLDKAGALRRPQPTPLLGQADLTRIDALVHEKLAERITVEDLARALDMPRWTFADAFKAATGDTPHAYVTAKRLDKACHFLRFSDMPLAEIAYATGFASQSHMTDTFRRVMGTTPGKWRSEVRQ